MKPSEPVFTSNGMGLEGENIYGKLRSSDKTTYADVGEVVVSLYLLSTRLFLPFSALGRSKILKKINSLIIVEWSGFYESHSVQQL